MVMQKQIQKQAEVEKELLGDIEQFVTPSYKKKLEEQRQFEEEQRKKEEAERARTVEGKKDMHAFYRNFVNEVALGGAKVEDTKGDNNNDKKQPSSADLDKKSSGDRDKYREDRDKRDSRQDYRSDDRNKKYRSNRSKSRSRSRDRKNRRDRSKSRSRSRDRTSRSDSHRRRDDRGRRSRSRSTSRSDSYRKRKREEETKESGSQIGQDSSKAATSAAITSADEKAKFARRNDDVAVSSARDRYLQRKAQMEAEAAKNAATNNAK